MKPHSVLVLTLCIYSALAQDSISDSVRDVMKIYQDCAHSEGLAPCLKMKVLSLVERVGRMEKISIMDGVILKGNPENQENGPTLEEEEKNLPRALDAKDKALSTMIFNRIARMIGSKNIEISVNKLVETARKGDLDFDDEKFGGGGGLGGGDKQKIGLHEKKEIKEKESALKMFIATLAAKKIAMIPLYLGALFILAVKALTTAKIALLIVGIIGIKKLLAAKQQQGHAQTQHINAGWSGGAGGHGGGGGGGGWSSGGWDKRSLDVAQNLAFNAQKPT